MILNKVGFDNFHEAIRIQNEIFPNEDGTQSKLDHMKKEDIQKIVEIYE